jgi:hypothetical protein
MLNFVEELVIFVLDLGSKSVAVMIDYIMVVVLSVLVVWLTIAFSKRIITLVTVDRSTIERRVVLGRLFGFLSFFGSSDVHNRCGSFVGRNTLRCGMKGCTVDSSVVMASFAMHKRTWRIVTEVVVTMVTEGGNHAMIGCKYTCMVVGSISVIATELDGRVGMNWRISLAIVCYTVRSCERNITVICHRVMGLLILGNKRPFGIVNSLELNTVRSGMLKLMEELVIFVLDLGCKSVAVMVDNIMVVIFSMFIMRLSVAFSKLVITHVGVTGCGTIRIGMPDSVVVADPVVGVGLNAVDTVMLINVLRVVLAIISVRVVVSHVVGALRLNVVVLAVLLAEEVTLVIKVGHVVAQIPVALGKVSRRVVLLSMHQDNVVVGGLRVRCLERGRLNAQVGGGEVGLLSALLFIGAARLRLLRTRLLFVEEGFFRAKALISFSLSLGRLGVVVRVVNVRSMSHAAGHLRIVFGSVRVSKVTIVTVVVSMGAVGVETTTHANAVTVAVGTSWVAITVRAGRVTITVGTWTSWMRSCTGAAHMTVVLLCGDIIMLLFL